MSAKGKAREGERERGLENNITDGFHKDGIERKRPVGRRRRRSRITKGKGGEGERGRNLASSAHHTDAVDKRDLRLKREEKRAV